MLIDKVARRKKMADEVASVPLLERREKVLELAHRYGVCRETVLKACKVYRIQVSRPRH